MRIRRVVTASALTVVLLAGCSGPADEDSPSVPPLVSMSTAPNSETPSPTPSVTPSETPSETSKVADTLCVRMDPTFVQTTLAVPVANIQPKAPPAELGIPTYDVCQFALSASPNGPVLRVGVSVLPATKAMLAATQKAYAAHPREPALPAKVGQGGYGTSTFLVFLLGGKMYKLSGPQATLAKYVALGQEVVRQAPGLPDAERLITRPECDRGTAAAEKVLGAPAMARRDGQTLLGDPVCGWMTSTSVVSTSVRRERDAKALMAPIRKLATSQSIPLGDEGYVDTATGRTTIRVGDDKIVDLVPLPARAINPDLMTQFALAMSPVYTR
ncbi:hypothetical protein EV651_111278 [Kribbella sp. VKM Ac-2571]|uniref:hypothetical protein n=1 Tax=Kribbella sp. VKM Ac-2571 TaxID=2512222 RepID=UPI00105BCCA9|nr:hypothetical protein [Kribbella sp. VKM Ac-2571]TDO57548.1 hypothetical protein EV651_111278 [Kribbella sp. VKM Ac-2571]